MEDQSVSQEKKTPCSENKNLLEGRTHPKCHREMAEGESTSLGQPKLHPSNTPSQIKCYSSQSFISSFSLHISSKQYHTIQKSVPKIQRFVRTLNLGCHHILTKSGVAFLKFLSMYMCGVFV